MSGYLDEMMKLTEWWKQEEDRIANIPLSGMLDGPSTYESLKLHRMLREKADVIKKKYSDSPTKEEFRKLQEYHKRVFKRNLCKIAKKVKP